MLGAGLALLVGPAADAGPPRALDPTFGTHGKVVTDFGHEDAIYGLVVQPDGKIVAVGDDYSGYGANDSFALARYTKAGALDPTFGLGGKVTTEFGHPSSWARAVALQRDGKIVVAGGTYSAATGTDIAVARYDAHGSLDGTFGTAGEVVTDLGGSIGSATSLLIQPDGKIVVAGLTRLPGSYDEHPPDFVVARYTTSGALDPTFGTGGVVTTGFQPGFSDIPSGVALGPGGKIVAAGTGLPGGASGPGVIDIARYNPNGALDPTFDGDGMLVSAPSSDNGATGGVVVQPDGKVVVAGYAFTSFGGMMLARYTAAGDFDPTFDLTTAPPGYAEALARQPDGKLVVVGTTAVSDSDEEFVVARFGRSGAPDRSFHGGYVVTDLGGWDQAQGVALAPDGKIVAGGVSGRLTDLGIDQQNFALARYLDVPDCRVPNVVGKTLRSAKAAIAKANCRLGHVRPRSARAGGRVVSQRPGPGRTLAHGSRIDLVVSRG